MSAKVLLHSGIMALTNLGSILLGFLVFALSNEPNQLSIQLPVAALVSVLAFVVWVKVAESRGAKTWRIRDRRDWVLIYALAPIWAALVFVPLHFLVEGYLTAFSNLVGLWAVQLVVNVAAVAIAMQFSGSRRVYDEGEAKVGDAARKAV